MNVADIQRVVETADRHSGTRIGNWCIFVPFGNGWGVKLYSSEYERDWAWIAQGYAAEVNAAPKVGMTFSMRVTPSMRNLRPHEVPLGDEVFGYVTECVEIPKYGITTEEYCTLEKKLLAIGLDMWDTTLHSNVGYLANGTAVQYDFDPNYALSFVLNPPRRPRRES